MIVSGLIYAVFLSIPVFILWVFIRTLRKTASGTEQIGLELKKLREEIQALREELTDKPRK